ncbi:MAG: hypothetical protein ACRDHM_10360 [Actinomycetota bacterium]
MTTHPRLVSWTRRLVASAAVSLVATSVPAGAETTDCAAHPPRLATLENPHVTDAAGDGASPWAIVHGPATDLIGAWITGPSAWESLSSQEPFRAVIRVAGMEGHPIHASYLWRYQTIEAEVLLIASASASGAWSFSYNWNDGEGWATNPVSGAIDQEKGTITMDIPPEGLPPRPADGSELRFPLGEIQARFFAGVPGGAGLMNTVDTAGEDCEITLYEAAPR